MFTNHSFEMNLKKRLFFFSLSQVVDGEQEGDDYDDDDDASDEDFDDEENGENGEDDEGKEND